MSTVNVTLYALWQRDRFVTSLTNPAAPSLPAIVAGDTWNISLYFVDDTSPMQLHRFAGAAVSARIRAAGNNHGYADAAGTEIAPADGAVVTTLANGGGSVISRKHVEFGSAPVSGSYRLTFVAPSSCRGNDPANQGVYTVHGTTAPIPFNASAADIAAAINALSWQKYDEHGDKVGGLFSPLTFAPAAFVVTNLNSTGFDIEYGTSLYTGSGGVSVNPQCYQTVPPGVALPTVDTSTLIFNFGWAISLPFTASDFSDYLIPANGPSYFEVMLNGAQAAFVQLTSNPGGGNAPAFTNGPPPNFGLIGSAYDFTATASGFPAPTFSLTSGTLPPGLSLTSGGRLSGIPTTTGTFSGVITATNSNGTVTQAFSITIGGGSITPGAPVHDLPANYNDGNFSVILEIENPVLEAQNEEHFGLNIWRRRFEAKASAHVRPAIGTLIDGFGYHAGDSASEDVGDLVERWTRRQHNIPPDRQIPWSGTKNFQAVYYIPAGADIADFGIISWSAVVNGYCNLHYSIGDPGALPPFAFVQVLALQGTNSYGVANKIITDFFTGFPTGPAPGGRTLYSDNRAVCFITGSRERVVGDLWVRKMIYA
jgi:hypothetical protein